MTTTRALRSAIVGYAALVGCLAVASAGCSGSADDSIGLEPAASAVDTTVETSQTADAGPKEQVTPGVGPSAQLTPGLGSSAPARPGPGATTEPRRDHWIAVADGGFVDTRTGAEFVPRGVNLLRKQGAQGDVLFRAYDPDWVDEQLDGIAAAGFNTIRFFLDLCMPCTADQDGVRSEYLDDLADLLSRMEARGLVALPTSNDVPDPGYSDRLPCCDVFGGYRNSLYLSAQGHHIAVEYFTDLVAGLIERGAPLHVVMGWQLANEQFFLRDVAPISLQSGSATAADGVEYDLSDDVSVETMVEENLLRYIATVGAAIRELDPTGLVTIGYFSASDPDAGRVGLDSRWVLPAVVRERGDIDFIDLHAYPGLGGRWDVIAPAFGLDTPNDLPLLLGEFGAFRNTTSDAEEAAAAMVRWQVASCAYGFEGWLVWLWGSQSDDEVITVNSGDGAIARALSPVTRPDPCDGTGYESDNLALGRPVAASLEESAEYGAPNAVDGSAATWWTAPDGPPQWIEIDLGEPRAVGRVEILVGSVSTPGPQTHRVYLRDEGETAPGRLAGEVSADARQGQVLVVELDPAIDPARYVRVETVEVDGWTILHEVSVYPPA